MIYAICRRISLNSTHTVVVQTWVESELGWGIRPDGYSLHATEEARKQYVQAFWDKMPSEPPDTYSRPNGLPYHAHVYPNIFATVAASKQHGVRFHGAPPPEPKAD